MHSLYLGSVQRLGASLTDQVISWFLILLGPFMLFQSWSPFPWFGVVVTQKSFPSWVPINPFYHLQVYAKHWGPSKMWCKIAHNYLVSGNGGLVTHCSSVITLAYVKPHLSVLLGIILTNEPYHALLGLSSFPSWCWQKLLYAGIFQNY